RHTICLSDWSSDVCSSDLGRKPRAVCGPNCVLRNCKGQCRLPSNGCKDGPGKVPRRSIPPAKPIERCAGKASVESVVARKVSPRSEERRVGKDRRMREGGS